MKLLRLCAFAVSALAITSCTKDVDGDIVTPLPLAGLRYVNLVPDTNNLDFRIIDQVSYAPNQVGASFRSGGNPQGFTTTLIPHHQPVEAGSHTIRVFVNHAHPDTASIVIYETTFDFVANTNYTMFLWGYRRAAGTPQISAMIVTDAVPALAANQFAVRAIHLAPTLAPTLAGTSADVWVDTLAAASAPVGTATFAAVQPGEVRNYVAFTARPAVTTPAPVAALNYRTAVSAAATTAPFVQVDVPNGTAGTSTANPISGDLVAGSAFTAIIVPPSVAGSRAAVFATPSIIYMTDQRPARTTP